MFAQIFICPKCGEVWQVSMGEDCGYHDEIYEIPICDHCYSICQEKVVDGHPVYHALTDEEIYWEQMASDDEDEEYDYDD